MNALRTSINSRIRLARNNQGFNSLLLPRQFSTESQTEAQNQNEAVDSFIRKPSSDLCYGRLQGITKYTTRSDVCNLLDGCELTLDDIRVEYNRSFAPVQTFVQFPSRNAFEAGLRTTRRDRLHRLDLADRSAWDVVMPYEGKCILLQGMPRNALLEDVERFLSGCEYESSTLKMFLRAGNPDPIRMATVTFPSAALAMHACITKDRGFCLNNQISVRVLQ